MNSRIVNTTGVEIWERLEWAREQVGWGQRELGREAGLKHDSHYSVVLRQFKAGGGIKAETLDLLVDALVRRGFSEAWLRKGVGPELSNERTVEYPERYPNRARAIALLVEAGEDEEECRSAAPVALDSDEDPDPLWWVDQIRAECARQRRGIRLGQNVVSKEEGI